jgi:6-phosphofructokinase 1
MRALFKEEGLFIEGMNEMPDIRESSPKYLIRSGVSSALDANFGRDLGSGAVVLLCNGITGVTVTGIVDGVVRFAPVEEMIRQRPVNERMIEFYETLGVCFGRLPVAYRDSYKQLSHPPWCYI